MEMLVYLAQACRSVRVAADVSLADVARAANTHTSGLSRFEAGRSLPREVGLIVDAYGNVVGVPPQMIWVDALRAWMKASGTLHIFEARFGETERRLGDPERRADIARLVRVIVADELERRGIPDLS